MNNISLIDILNEAVDINLGYEDTEFMTESIIEDNLIDLIESIDEINTPIIYTEEMIPVIEYNMNYYVEMDMLEKLVKSKHMLGEYCTLESALNLLEHVNHIEGIKIVIESNNILKQTIQRLKKMLKREKDPKKKAILTKRISDTKNKMEKLKDENKIVKTKDNENLDE